MRSKQSSRESRAHRRSRQDQARRSRASRRGRPQLSIEALESRAMMAVTTFQHGVSGYEGTQDTVIFSLTPDSNFGAEGHISADQQDFNAVRQGLLKFEGLFGSGPGQIPLGSTINSATLDVFVQDDSNSAMQMSLYRMMYDWNESVATWNNIGVGVANGGIGGVQASEGESSDLPPDAVLLDSETDADRPATAGKFDVKKSLEYWAAGSPNYGWLVESAATNGWDFRTKESNVADRPKLIVDYTPPAPAASFQALSSTITQAEGHAGTRIARVDIARLGNLSAAASVNYTVTAGGANPAQADDFVAVTTPQALHFAANQGLATIEVVIHGDTALEGQETVLVTLTGGPIVAGRGETTVTIGDDDILINEVLANVTNSDDETDREYIELLGTPGANLAGYYFVVFEGEEEGDSGSLLGGSGSGVADFVIDLSPYTFGANGLLVFVPGDPTVAGMTWKYAAIADPLSNIVELPALMGAGGKLEDNSQTYAIIRSPGGAIVQGMDYDTIGTYEVDAPASGFQNAIGIGVGILDQLPAGAQLIDSVGVVEGGGNDRDRVATTAALGHPGVHVHQPTPFTPGGNVTSDAVSRRIGQTLPNSIGAWYNGDISSGVPVGSAVNYLEDSFFISVVAPDGAVLTPGAPNVLRNVFFRFTDQLKSVAEADGSVTIRIERTGDIAHESLTVTYQTVDVGSAKEGVDYTGKTESVTFLPGESFKDVTILINAADGLAEGFERFRVKLSNASGGYRITNGSPTGAGNPNGEATITIRDANVSVATFQNDNANLYAGTSDAYIDGSSANNKFGQDPIIRVDQAAGTGSVRPQQALIKFADLFGDGPGQVPWGAQIFDAFLTVNVTNTAAGANIALFRMLQDWEEINATWELPQGNAGFVITNGVTPDGFEATAKPDAIVTEPGKAGKVQIPLNPATIQSWASGSLPNFGWSIVSNDAALWQFNSSEAFLLGTFKPELTILYTAPASNPGTFGFSVEEYVAGESGGTATVAVNRYGGSQGAAAVNWAVTEGTGTLADITGAAAAVLNFAAGELFKTFTIAINNDALIERNETLNLALSGAGLTFGRSTATLTIRDNDFVPASGNLLLNEILMNSPGNDPPHEFIELIGLANMGMGSLYYVAVEGLVGFNEGAFDKVVDLGPYANGSNGLSLLTPQKPGFAFNVNPATTHIQDLGTVATENVNTNNDSVTIMILYSPTRELSSFQFDYDWDNDGALDLPLGVQVVDSLGVRTLGLNDQVYGPTANILSFTATEVDAISRKRNDSDRNDGTAWFGGNLLSAGDDYLLYQNDSIALPVSGAAMSPGDLNAGTDAQSPLIKLISVTPNADGAVTVAFTGPVSQVLNGDGSVSANTGSGISITDVNGLPIAIVDSRPVVTGLGTSTLTLSFTGSGVSGGKLPPGAYQLNFIGNGMVANSRAVDVANNGTAINGKFEFEFTVTSATLTGDYDRNGRVDGNDFLLWQVQLGTTPPQPGGGADGDGLGTVDHADLGVWAAHFGEPHSEAASLPALAAAVTQGDAASAGFASDSAIDSAVLELARAADAFRGATARTALGRPARRAALGDAAIVAAPAAGSVAVSRSQYHDLDELFADLGDDAEEGLAGCGHALAAALSVGELSRTTG